MNAQYILQSCNLAGCIDGEILQVDIPSFVNSIGYFKSDNDSGSFFGGSVSLNGNGDTLATRSAAFQNDAVYIFVRKDKVWLKQAVLKASFPGSDAFGTSVDLSQDGNTLVVSAPREMSSGTGVGVTGSTDNSLESAGAVYVFVRNNETWAEQAFIKASNTSIRDQFGSSISLSADGNTLAVGVQFEDSDSTGINGTQNNDNVPRSGAVYVFKRNNTEWLQDVYIKSSNAERFDQFGVSVSLSGDGRTLAVGASGEDGLNNTSENEGAVYIFVSTIVNNENSWVQQQYLKPSVIDAGDGFGNATSLNFDGNTLVVTSGREDSASQDNPNDNSKLDSGAAYVFTRVTDSWSQQAYLKAVNSAEGDLLGSVSINNAGDFFVVGSEREKSNAKGINGEIANRDQLNAGAAYIFTLNDTLWSQQAFIKASNTKLSTATNASLGDFFGISVSVSGDKSIIAIGSLNESSTTAGINGDQNTTGDNKGAVYLY